MTEKQKSNNASSKSSGCLRRKKFNQKIKSQLKNYPKDIEKISSLRQFSRELNISRNKIKCWLLQFLEKYYNDQATQIFEEIWLYRLPKYDHSQKKQAQIDNFMQIIKAQLANYPDNVEEIMSLRRLGRILGIERNTVTNWIKKYLVRKYSNKNALDIFKEIWTNRQGTSRAVSYNRIKEFLSNRDARILTSEGEYDAMSLQPTKRKVEVECEIGHSWFIRVDDFLLKGRWCPVCLEPKTQKVMRMFMESIFGGTFPERSLKQAFGIDYGKGGSLRFDGYNEEVLINGKKYRIAFEYDGSQHDVWPNPFHRTKNQFERQQLNDQRKNDIAEDSDVVLIRLKEIDGFDYYHIHRFEREILRKFYKQTRIRLMFRNRYYNLHSNLIKYAKGPLDEYL